MQMKIKSMYLCVQDMERAIGFYEELLEQPVYEKDEIYSVFDLHGFRLGLFAYGKTKEQHTYGSNCLPSLEVEDIAAFQDKLNKMNGTMIFPLTVIGSNQVLEFQDTEGNHIEVTTPVKNKRAELVRQLWKDIDAQNWDRLGAYFSQNARILWPNTKECFDVHAFTEANRRYPGAWKITVDRIEEQGEFVTTIARVYLPDESVSFHAVSFFEFKGDTINLLTEYWGDDGEPPEWRKEL